MKASEFLANSVVTLGGDIQLTDVECCTWVVSTFGGGYSWPRIGGFVMDCGGLCHDSHQGNVKPSFLIAELDDPRDLVAGWSCSGMVFGGDLVSLSK